MSLHDKFQEALADPKVKAAYDEWEQRSKPRPVHPFEHVKDQSGKVFLIIPWSCYGQIKEWRFLVGNDNKRDLAIFYDPSDNKFQTYTLASIEWFHMDGTPVSHYEED